MSAAAFDRRLTPARPDLAADHLRGRVEAATFVPGGRRSVVTPTAPLRREPRSDCGLDTEALRGAVVTVYEETVEGWAWGQLERDGYVGYLPSEALGPLETPTHAVAALRTFVYAGPSLKTPAVAALSLGSRLAVSAIDGDYAACAGGFVWAGHLAGLDARASDFVAVAERFRDVPYLWGGASSLGLDCSALVQLSLATAGVPAPRDSDLQARDLGTAVPDVDVLRRGDLVFWKGHVGIMRDATTLLHANGFTMTVASEPLAVARARILAATGADVTAVKRLDHAAPRHASSDVDAQ